MSESCSVNLVNLGPRCSSPYSCSSDLLEWCLDVVWHVERWRFWAMWRSVGHRQGCNCTSLAICGEHPLYPFIIGMPLPWVTYIDLIDVLWLICHHFVITLCVLVLGFTRFTCQDSTDLTSDLTSKVSAVTLQENASDGNMVTVSWHLSRWALRRPCVSLVMLLTLRLSNCVTWRMATQIEDEAW